MKKSIMKLIMNLLYCLPKGFAHKIYYYHRMKRKLNLKNPIDLNEKIQWLIVYRYGIREADYTDKLIVKQKLEKFDEKLHIPKLYFSFDSVNQIDYDKLPDKFVLKTNNGCGNVFICRDKKNFDLKNAKAQLKKTLKEKFAKKNLEYHYSYIKPKIICEEFLDDNSGKLPTDYKFYCFNGVVKCILVCTDRIDENNKSISYFDIKWNKLDYEKDKYKNNKIIEKPKNLSEMLRIASKLSKDFNFVRVDLYNINGDIYFGELTFTPACGMINNITQVALNQLGNNLKL